MWVLMRWVLRRFFRLAIWQQLLVVALLPLVSLNLAVSFFGESLVSPVSPFFLREKWQALTAYAAHRPGCAWSGHPDLDAVVDEAEVRHGLPRGLLHAVVEVESEGRPHRISYAGAMGPAQLTGGTAAQLGVKDPFDTRESIDGGARYLSTLLRRKKDVRLAVAAYNAGPGAVGDQVPRIKQTEAYVAKVMSRFRSTTGR